MIAERVDPSELEREIAARAEEEDEQDEDLGPDYDPTIKDQANR
jgi:hypothetical protein